MRYGQTVTAARLGATAQALYGSKLELLDGETVLAVGNVPFAQVVDESIRIPAPPETEAMADGRINAARLVTPLGDVLVDDLLSGVELSVDNPLIKRGQRVIFSDIVII